MLTWYCLMGCRTLVAEVDNSEDLDMEPTATVSLSATSAVTNSLNRSATLSTIALLFSFTFT